VIQFDNVTKFYRTGEGRKWILRGQTFAFERGCNVGILGRNGSGKSTLLRLLCGMEQPSSGTVRRTATVSWPLGFAGGVQGSLTGEENARFVARLYGADTADVVRFVAAFSELGRDMKLPVRMYSSGMRARLLFAMSMAIGFECYLVDELIAVGDQFFQEKCRRAFQDRRASSSVIVVSHQVRTIRDYSDHVAVLHDSRLHYFTDKAQGFAFYDTVCAR
jgi:capsular polysaccharide transport system ATP-binding protein